jgi:hypothetical protein
MPVLEEVFELIENQQQFRAGFGHSALERRLQRFAIMRLRGLPQLKNRIGAPVLQEHDAELTRSRGIAV